MGVCLGALPFILDPILNNRSPNARIVIWPGYLAGCELIYFYQIKNIKIHTMLNRYSLSGLLYITQYQTSFKREPKRGEDKNCPQF